MFRNLAIAIASPTRELVPQGVKFAAEERMKTLVPGVGVEPMMSLKTRKLLIPQSGKNPKTRKSA